MNKEKYFIGEGLDVSKNFYLYSEKKVKHGFVEPNNFYTLKKFANYETLDFIYSKNLINETKFYKILLKEWSYFCRVGGFIIIEMSSNEILSFGDLEKCINLLLSEKFKIVEKNSKAGLFVIKKLKPSLKKGDSIGKWSFGIITDGSKKEILEKQIDSIIDLKIPHFEIIVCGSFKPSKKHKKYVKVVPFNYPLAWISKKKNLIAKKAKYENLVIAHNRFRFDKKWYEGMKKYGNYFSVLNCKILDPLGRRAGDWLTYGRDIEDRWISDLGILEYCDWDKNIVINGSFYILKKESVKKCPWDESRVWGQSDDDWISLDFHKKGFVPRINIHSIVYTFPEIYGEWHWKYLFNKKMLGKIKCDNWKRYFSRKIDHFLRQFLKLGLVKKPEVKSYGWISPNEFTTTEPNIINKKTGAGDF